MSETREALQNSVDRFIFQWHDFPFDYWWRKKYGVPFGSPMHREMSFIDMYIEWRECLMMTRSQIDYDDFTPEDEEALGLMPSKAEVVHVSQEEIEEDYENLNLEDFNKDTK